MGVGYSRAAEVQDPVVRHLDFDQTGRTPLGALSVNQQAAVPGRIVHSSKKTVQLAFPDPPSRKLPATPASRKPPATPEMSETARKDDGLRKKALAQLRGEAVQQAVASQLAVAASQSNLSIVQLKSLQAHAQAIAAASTAELQSAASEVESVHQRALERARRIKAGHLANLARAESGGGRVRAALGPSTDGPSLDSMLGSGTPCIKQVQVCQHSGRLDESPLAANGVEVATVHMTDAAQPPTTTEESNEPARAAVTTPATSQNGTGCTTDARDATPLHAPANLPPPRSTPNPNTPARSGVNVAAAAHALNTAGAFEGPEYVMAYLTVRREQLREQKVAVRAMLNPVPHLTRPRNCRN